MTESEFAADTEAPPPTEAVSSALPWGKVIPIYIAIWCEAFNSSSIFAYVGYMILDFGLSKDKNDPAFMYYAGLLGSCYFGAQLISSFFWGTLSDRVGRKPILLIGQSGSMCASILFGLATAYPWAVAARSMSGLLNGTVGVSKTYLGEICDSSNVARAFSWIGLMWGFGAIAGSVFGGMLARPAKQYPNVFSATGVFGKRPYLIPNLLAAAVTFTGLLLIFFFLTENKKKAHPPPAEELELREELHLQTGPDSDMVTASTETSSDGEAVEMIVLAGNSVQNTPRDSPMLVSPHSAGSPAVVTAVRSNSRGNVLSRSGEIRNTSVVTPQAPSHHGISHGGGHADATAISLHSEEGPAYIGGYESLSTLPDRSLPWYRRGWIAKVTQLPAYFSSLPIFQEPAPVMTCALYALFGALQTMADEIWPLWALTPVNEGGLDFSTNLIGIVNAWAGAVQLLFNLVLYPLIAKRFGLVRAFWIGIVASGLVYFLYPAIRYVPLPVPKQPWTAIRFWFALGMLAMFRQCAAQTGFSSVMTLISNSVYPEVMGSANGLGQSLVAFTRMIAPFSSAAILALSLGKNTVFPFNYGRLAWWSVSLMCVITLIFSFRLPTSLNKPRIEAEEDKNAALQASHLSIVVTEEEEETGTQAELTAPAPRPL